MVAERCSGAGLKVNLGMILDDVTGHISQEGFESGSKLAPAGLVSAVVRGMILAKTVPIALAEVPMAINQDMGAIIPAPKIRFDFLLYALETLRGNLFKKVKGRSGNGTATLMSNEISGFEIPLPDLDEQQDVAAEIASRLPISRTYRSGNAGQQPEFNGTHQDRCFSSE